MPCGNKRSPAYRHETQRSKVKPNGQERCLRPFWLGYFRLLATVKSAENLATNIAPHQADPKPLGLMLETFEALNVGF